MEGRIFQVCKTVQGPRARMRLGYLHSSMKTSVAEPWEARDEAGGRTRGVRSQIR